MPLFRYAILYYAIRIITSRPRNICLLSLFRRLCFFAILRYDVTALRHADAIISCLMLLFRYATTR